MAGRMFTISHEGYSAIVAGQTALQLICGANAAVAIRSIDIGFQGNLNTERSIQCLLKVQTGGTGTTVTPTWVDTAIPTSPHATALHTVTGESDVETLWNWRIHPQASREKIWPVDKEMPIIEKAQKVGLYLKAVDNPVTADITISCIE